MLSGFAAPQTGVRECLSHTGFILQKDSWISIGKGVSVWAVGQQKKYFYYTEVFITILLELAAVIIVFVKEEF